MKFDKKNLIFKCITTAVAILTIAFIFYNSMKPATESSESSGRVLAFLNGVFKAFGFGPVFTQSSVRTLAHFCEFGLLGVTSFLMYLSFLKFNIKDLFLSLATVLFVALSDECIQIFSAGRAFQLEDMFIDFIGGAVGSGILFLLIFIVNYVKSRRFKNEQFNQ